VRVIFALAAVGLSAWALFYAYATNSERLASSVMQQIMQTARTNPELEQMLGEAIRPEPAWYLNGDPWVNGSVYVDATCYY
jgi:cytochrome c oxidase assembly factor 1